MSAPDAFAPASLGPVELRNRIIKSATFEGCVPDGVVSPELIDFHSRLARGGVGLTTVAYLAVSGEGRTHREQIVLGEDTAPGLAELTDAVHEAGAAIGAQVGHAGPVANPSSNRATALAPSPAFTPLGMQKIEAVTTDDMARIRTAYADAARICVSVGFDVIEVHLGHSYLLSAFLSPLLNRRRDAYGRTLEGRARFPREVLEAVGDAVDGRAAITVKLGMDDGVPRSVRPAQSLPTAKMLEADGIVDAIELSAGSSLLNPMYLFRGEAPRRSFAATLPPSIRKAYGLFSPVFMRRYPYQEAFLRDTALEFRRELSLPLIQLGGISKLATIERAMADGFEFVAMARALLAEPDLISRYADGVAESSGCTHCNECMPTIYSGTRCVLPEPRRAHA